MRTAQQPTPVLWLGTFCDGQGYAPEWLFINGKNHEKTQGPPQLFERTLRANTRHIFANHQIEWRIGFDVSLGRHALA